MLLLILAIASAYATQMTHFIARAEAQATTTTVGWSNVTGTAETGTVASTNGWIDASNLIAGDDYLILVWGAHQNNNNASQGGMCVTHGGTRFSGSEAIAESDRTGTAYKMPYFWFTVWTAVATEDIEVQMYCSANTARVEDITLVAIHAEDLQTHGDLYYQTDEVAAVDLTTSYVNKINFNWTPANAGDTWWIAGYVQSQTASNTANDDLWARLRISGTARNRLQVEGENTSDTPLFGLGWVDTYDGSQQDVRVQLRYNGVTSQQYIGAGAFALRLNAFDSFAAYSEAGDGTPMTVISTPYKQGNIVPTVNAVEDWLIAAGAVIDDPGRRVLGYLQMDAVDITDRAGGWQIASSDKTPMVLGDMQYNLASGTKNIDFDCYWDNGTGQAEAEDRWVVAFSMEPEYMVWDGGGSDGKWSTAKNWKYDVVPSATDSIVFNGTSAAACTLDVSPTVANITLAGDYSGDFSFGSQTLTVTGEANFATGGTITGATGTLAFTGGSAQQFTPKTGQTFPAITQNGAGGTTILSNELTAGALTVSTGTLNLGTGLTHTVASIATSGGTLDFSSSTLQVTGNANLNGSTITVGTGTLEFTGTGTQTFTPKATVNYNPDISHTGSGTLDIAANFYCTDFSQSAGGLNFNGFDITSSGNFIITNGASTTISGLDGAIISFAGSATLSGTPSNLLNLNGSSGWNITRSSGSGSITASYCNIAYSTASSPPGGNASQSTDGGNNPNWTFDTEDYNTWSYTRKIYINTTTSGADISGNVTDFPMLVRLTSSNFTFAQAQSAGQDIRFSTSDGTHLSYEIERFTSPNAEIWVKLGTVYGNNNTQYFNMHWGNGTALDRSAPSTVFSAGNNFTGVYHMGDFNANTYASATGANDGTATNMAGTNDAAAVCGLGTTFNGTNEYITTSDAAYDFTDNFTISTWMYTSDASGDWARIIDKVGRWSTGYGIGGKNGTYGFVGYWSASGWGADPAGSFEPLSDATWYYVTATISGGVSTAYRDGVPVSTFSGYSGQTIRTNNFALCFGKSSNAGAYWAGSVDEIRIEDTPRSDDWIKLCYETQKPGSGVLTTPKTWDGGGSDSSWSTAENWTDDVVPSSTDDVLFNGTSVKDCDLAGGTVTIKSLAFTSAYTGVFDFGTGNTLNISGNADFSSGGTISAGTGNALGFTGTSPQIFLPKSGATYPAVTINGSGGTTITSNGLTAGDLTLTDGTLNLGSGLTHSVDAISGSAGGGLHFNSSTLSASGNVTLTNITLTAGTGTLKLNGSLNQTFTPVTGCPNISHTSANRVQLLATLSGESFVQSSGSLDFNGFNITTTGNFSVSSGTDTSFTGLDGRTITVGGSATLVGRSGSLLNLNPSTTVWTATVTGNLTANYAAINRSTATNANGQASVYCTNGGVSVTGWTFDTEDYATWNDSKNLYVNTTSTGANVSGNVSNFPLLIRLTSANFTFADAMTNGEDVRFSQSDLTPLSYEIEDWDNAGETASLWVILPTIYGNNKSQYIKMYWGKAASVSKSNSSAVYSSANGYTAAWHINNSLADATSNANTLTDRASSNNTGSIVEQGRSFSGTNQNLNIASSTSFDALTTFTMSGWAQTANNATTAQTLYSFYIANNDYAYIQLANNTNGICVKNWINGMNNGWQVVTNWVPTNNTWFHCTWVIDGAKWLVYIDGQLSASAAQTMDLSDLNNGFYGSIGARRTGAAAYSSYLNGLMDQVEVSSVARDSNWIKLSYETQKTGASCVDLSSAPAVSGPSDSGFVGAYQQDKDSVIIRYEVEDPDGGTVIIKAEYKASGGSWTDMTDTRGEGSVAADDGTVVREVGWGAGFQLGTVENSYYVRIIADDGTDQDTTESALFVLDTRGPTGLSALSAGTITGTSVALSWSAVSDNNWSHYKLFYGTVRNDVRDSTGTAVAWDSTDDPDLTTITTTSTTIPGLSSSTAYYFKIWAFDTWGNVDTVANISATTITGVAPAWSITGLGSISGGAITADEIYIGTGSSVLQKFDLVAGASKWSYSTLPDACGMPTYKYEGGYYNIVAAAGDNIVGVRDDGGTNKTQLFAKQSLTGAGTPYMSTESGYFYVPYSGNLDKRNLSDGTSAGGAWPQALATISTTADIVVYNNEVYVATTTGLVYKYTFAGAQSGPFDTQSSITLPLIVVGGSLYITPNSAKIFKISTSTMDTTGGVGWEFALPAANTGPAFVNGSSIYAACGNYVRKLTDNGSTATGNWTSSDLGATVTSGPIPYNSVVYVGRNSGEFHALKDSDGTAYNTDWPYMGASGNGSSGPWIDDTRLRILFGTTGGELEAFVAE